MKKLIYILMLVVLLLPTSAVFAYEEGDVTADWNTPSYGDVEMEPETWYEFANDWYIETDVTLNVGETVSIWILAQWDVNGFVDTGESYNIGWSISGAGGSTYSGRVVAGVDAGVTFNEGTNPAHQFYPVYGPAVIDYQDYQYLEITITDNGGLPSQIKFMDAFMEYGSANVPHTYMVQWGILDDQTDCDSDYLIQEEIVTAGEIDATDEDGEYTEISTGSLYRLEVYGGPWNDSVDDRYDVAVSYDGATWYELSWLMFTAVCVDVDPDHPELGTIFFLADSDDFYIRVNDEAAEFADNSGTMTYDLSLVIYMPPLNCGDQFTWNGEGGAKLGSYNVPANQAAGVEVEDQRVPHGMAYAPLEIGEWYVLVTTDGPWLDDGSGGDRYDMAVKDTTGTWEPLADYEMLECQEDAEDLQHTVYYFQAWAESLWVRVNDTGGVWGTNTGSMGVDLYAAEYDRFLDTCEMTYILGDLVSSKNFMGNQSGGVDIGTYDHFNNIPRSGGGEGPVEVLRYYILDTLDGPWYDSSDPLYSTQMNKIENNQWYETPIHPELDCVAETDLLGHVRVYFDMDKPYHWSIRVNETTAWTDNSGSMRYNLYEATNGQIGDPDDPPEAGYCDDYYTPGDAIGSITFQATNSGGVYVPGMTEYNTIYSIKTTGGPWNDGAEALYDVALSDDGGTTWYPIANYPGLLCAELGDDANHVQIYLQFTRGRRYKVRVDDDTTFGDNSGNMGITVYGAESDVDPWDTCSDHYRLEEIALPDPDIWAMLPGGEYVPYIQPSSEYIYAIEITEGPWTDDGADSYSAEIFDGNWYNHNSYGICSEQVGDSNQYFRTYFDPVGSTYKLRANDQDDDFLNNAGTFGYKLYRAYVDDSGTGDDDGGTGDIPDDWDLSCYTPCTRPGGFFKNVTLTFGSLGSVDLPLPAIDDWLEYGRCAFTKFISWCPEHTAALKSIPLLVRNREPFNSLYVLANAASDIQDDIDSFDWYPDSAPSALMTIVSGGGEGESTNWSFIPDMENSPWNNGEITYGDGGTIPGGGEGNDLDCPDDMKAAAASAFGVDESAGLIAGYCFVVRTPFVLKAYWMWITLSVEISFIFFFIKYLVSRLRSLL